MKENPKCPYCGEEMKLNNARVVYWYFCPHCMASSPDAISKEAAYVAAMKRHKEEKDE